MYELIENHSCELPQDINDLLYGRPALGRFIPAAPNECFDFGFEVLGQLGPEVFLGKFELDVPEGQLSVLPVERDHFEEDDPEGVDVCVLAGLENHAVFVPQVLHRSVKRLVAVASDERQVFLEAQKAEPVENHLSLLDEYVVWG